MELIGISKKYTGGHLSYYELSYKNLDGKLKVYEMVSRNPNLTMENIGSKLQAVALFVFNEDHNKILLNKEFRLAVNKYVINTVAGLVDPGEDAVTAAARELYEETQVRFIRPIQVCKPSYICPGVVDELSQLIICEAEGEPGESDSPNEEIEAKWYTKEEIKAMLADNSVEWSSRTQALCIGWALQ